MELHLLDLSHFTHGTPSERVEFANQLVDGLTRHGFVRLVNHGFSETAIHQLHEMSKRFFDLSPETKSQVANPPGPNPQRGWTGVGIETTSRLADDEEMWALADAKEHFDQGPTDDPDFPNRWLPDATIPGFRPFMERSYSLCDEICMQVMRALETGLQLPLESLTALCIPSASDMRLNHYPALRRDEVQDGRTSRISPHTDFGAVSLLLQDGVGGLEIEERESGRRLLRAFVAVPPVPDEMIVNASDTLQRWTNDVVKAGLHRVTVPTTTTTTTGIRQDESEGGLLSERFSMAYFFKAGRGASVGPLPQFADSQRQQQQQRNPKYQDMTALEYQKRRNQQMYAT